MFSALRQVNHAFTLETAIHSEKFLSDSPRQSGVAKIVNVSILETDDPSLGYAKKKLNIQFFHQETRVWGKGGVRITSLSSHSCSFDP